MRAKKGNVVRKGKQCSIFKFKPSLVEKYKIWNKLKLNQQSASSRLISSSVLRCLDQGCRSKVGKTFA